jgi:FkbM family methyltransferase
MSMLRTIVTDAVNINKVCGPWTASRWLAEIGLNWRACLRDRNLQPADRALGAGPFKARLGNASATMTGEAVFSGVREIWVRDVYLQGGFLSIPPNATVVDLGANVGNFTLLALGHGAGVRVVSVEANTLMCEQRLLPGIRNNGWADRALIVNAFVGGQTQLQDKMLSDGECAGAQNISEAQLIERAQLTSIDFLKCDIEGSEFDLLTPQSKLLAMSKQVAIEVHAWGGDTRAFCAMLTSLGFDCRVTEGNAESLIVLARRERLS